MIPNSTDPRWKRVLTSDRDLDKVSLATKILISRLRLKVSLDPTKVGETIEELRTYFCRNAGAANDVAFL